MCYENLQMNKYKNYLTNCDRIVLIHKVKKVKEIPTYLLNKKMRSKCLRQLLKSLFELVHYLVILKIYLTVMYLTFFQLRQHHEGQWKSIKCWHVTGMENHSDSNGKECSLLECSVQLILFDTNMNMKRMSQCIFLIQLQL